MIKRPKDSEFAAHYKKYVDLVPRGSVLKAMQTQHKALVELIRGLSEEKLAFQYAPGKWTIKEILVHIIDAERIFAYRALRFARHDKTELPGFEENDYAPESQANLRTVESILKEYSVTRKATIEMFKNFTPAMLDRIGIASSNPMSVKALAFSIAGHELHHVNVIKERYL